MLNALMRRILRSNTFLRRLYYRFQWIRGVSGQSDEGMVLVDLTKGSPKTFIEFGFHPIQFNCAALARDKEWLGLLIDGSKRQVDDARSVLPSRVEIRDAFLTLENLDSISSTFRELGVLSIDVDGNDYWFLEALIEKEPSVISVEYNASFGPTAAITIPYDPNFDRHAKHPSGWYHGASLIALCKLCARHGYGLAAISEAGANAFFTKTGKLDPQKAWKPNLLRNAWSMTSTEEQWRQIQDLPYVEI